jgi:predicted nucleotidyltransferase
VTKVNEHAYVPEIDDAALQRLREALDMEGVVAAMLIGSQARGEAGPLSDVDIAIWHEPGIEDSKRVLELQLSLMGAASRALGTGEVDVVMLNHAPPLLQQRAIRDAVRLVERDRAQRVRFETRAVLDYLDTAPLRVALKENLKRQFEEDRFGRPR